jgi:hypothetical protein
LRISLPHIGTRTQLARTEKSVVEWSVRPGKFVSIEKISLFSPQESHAHPIQGTSEPRSTSPDQPARPSLVASLKSISIPPNWREALRWAFIATLTLRLGLGLVMGAAWLVAKPYLPVEAYSNSALYDGLPVPFTSPADAALGVWVRWDAVHHLNLARLGYFQASEGDSVFFPLFPALTRLASLLTGGDYTIAGLVISTLACVAALALLYMLAETYYGTLPAKWAIVVLAAFPTAVFLVAPYSESLFLSLTLAAFLAARKRRWWLAGVMGFLAGLTRPNGMIISAAFMLLALQEWREDRPRLLGRRSVSMLGGISLPLIGGLAFLAWRSANGFPPISQILEEYSGLVMADPLTGLTTAITQWLRVHDLPTTLDVASALGFIALIAFMVMRPRWRRAEWITFAAANMLLFLSKRSFVASSLQSMSRYVLVLFPVFIVVGDWLSSRSRWTRLLYTVLSGAMLILLSVAYSLWLFVG